MYLERPGWDGLNRVAREAAGDTVPADLLRPALFREPTMATHPLTVHLGKDRKH